MSSSPNFPGRSELLAQAQSLLAKKPFTKEDRSRFDGLLNMAEAVSPGADELRIARARQLGRELGLPESRGREQETSEQRSFRQFLIHGEKYMSDAERAHLRKVEARDSMSGMVSGAGAFPGSGSGFFTPVQFHDDVLAMLKKTDAIFDPDVVTFIDSERGGPFSYPCYDDTSISATIVAQGTQSARPATPYLGALSLATCDTWRSGELVVSMEFDEDSAFNLVSLLAKVFAVRFRRGIGAAFVSTILAAADSSGQTVIGDDNATSPDPTRQIGYADLLNLIGALDPEYLASERCGWLMNFNSLLFLLNLRDQMRRPLLPIVHDAAGRLTLFEKPIHICPSAPDIGHGQRPILFGALDRIIVRVVKDSLAVRRYAERYAEFGAIAFEGFWRVQCGLQRTLLSPSPVMLSPSPVLYLQNA